MDDQEIKIRTLSQLNDKFNEISDEIDTNANNIKSKLNTLYCFEWERDPHNVKDIDNKDFVEVNFYRRFEMNIRKLENILLDLSDISSKIDEII